MINQQHMKVVEQHVIGKVNDEMCEDSVVETDGFVAVIDGATSKSSVRYDGLKGGKKQCYWHVSVLCVCRVGFRWKNAYAC